ncbi:MAG: SusC/RagA family TonB-linked outer membrane protein, partial [Sediminibacterium sp.]|nr:SusC/RagA family TonB-linked outer membrane protein [Sediminibacterium sp.]
MISKNKLLFARIFCIYIFSLIMNGLNAQSQPAVSGRVTDKQGEALIGVNVVVKGTTQGTITDFNGNYTIAGVKPGVTLQYSYLGYNTVNIIFRESTINVVMEEESKNLEEVMVVGYASQKKATVTGAINSVKSTELLQTPVANISNALAGRTSGLIAVQRSGEPGKDQSTLRVRGIATLNSGDSSEPLVLVDGVERNFNEIDANEIETINILKDASATAVFGVRGANGVIAVTSKKASKGETKINFQSSTGIQKVNDRIQVVNADGFKKLYNAQLSNLGASPFDYTNYTANTNWQDLVLRNALITANNLSVSNSGDKSTTYLNIGYTNQEGVLRNDNYKRYLVRLNQEIRFNDKIKVGAEVTGYHWLSNPPAASITNALWAAPIVGVQQDQNTYYSMPSFQRAQVGNPIAALNRGDGTSLDKGFRVIGNIYGEVKFAKYFTWRSTFYADLAFNNNRGFTRLPYTFINLGEGSTPTNTSYDNSVKTAVSQSQSESKRYQQDHTLQFARTFNGKHVVSALAGFTSIYSYSSYLNASRRDTSVNINDNPDFWYIGVSNANNPGNYDGGGGESAIMGYFGRVSYSYLGKYLLNATVRRDGSSKFAPQNRWGTFGSVGLGWIVSDEKFFSKFKGINFLKIRGAWGLTGNANGFADNLYKPGVSNASTAIFGDNIYSSIQSAYIPGPNLHWETVRG